MSVSSPSDKTKPRDRTGTIFLMPAVIWVLLFTIFPLLYALYTSFWSFRFGQRNQFVGLTNFGRLFTDSNFHNGLMVTFTFVIVTVTVEMVLGFALALLLNQEIRGKNVLRAIMILPLFATPVAMGFLGITLFYEENGPINEFIRFFGGEGVPWLSSARWAPDRRDDSRYLAMDAIRLSGFARRAAEPAVDLYEAAEVDGANSWQTFRSITMPLMAPTLWLILLLRLVEAFKVFDIPSSLTRGGPGRATEVVSLFTYRTALRFFDHGYAAAQGFLLLFIVMFIVTFYCMVESAACTKRRISHHAAELKQCCPQYPDRRT